MGRKARHGKDWQNRQEDRQKSLARQHDRIKKIDLKERKAKKKIEKDNKSTFGHFEENVDQKYKELLRKEIFLVGTQDGLLEKMRPGPIYEELASLFLQARENIGIYVVLTWPEGIDWPYFSQILANKTITSNCRYEEGLRVSFYPSASRNINRGKDIRINKNELIAEAREAAQNNCLCSRHNSYFALNDFDKDEKDSIRQNPSVIESTPFFELSDDFDWNVIGGGYFKDIYRYMFNVTGNKRRSVIENLARQINDPNKTKEGGFLIESSVSAKQATILSLKPVKTDILYIDGRSKVLNATRGGGELIKAVMGESFKNDQSNSLVVVVDDPNIYKRAVYDAVELIKENKKAQSKVLFKRFSFFVAGSGITTKEVGRDIGDRPQKFGKPPEIIVTGRQGYSKMAKLYKITRKIEMYDKKLCRQMYRAIGYVDRLMTLPIAQAELRRWIRDLTENWPEADANRLAKKYLWKSYRREWVQSNESSGAIASKDEFLKLCDEIEKDSAATNEVSELLINHLIDGGKKKDVKSLVLVKERRIREFVKDMLSDILTDDEISVEVEVYSIVVDASKYDDVYILGLKNRELKDILFSLPCGKRNTKVFISTPSAFKIESELDIVLELDSFNSVHDYIYEIKNQITPILDSIRHMGVPTELGSDKSDRNTYDYDCSYTSYAHIYLSNGQAFDVGKETTILRFSNNEFFAVSAENLEEGEWILPLDGFIEDVETELGKSLPRANKDSDLLKSYFQMAQKNLSNQFDYKARRRKASEIYKLMQQIDSVLSKEIHEGMINRWIKHIEEFSSEDELTSNSAKKKRHFLLFAKAIGISEALSNIIWEDGIKVTRVNHIQAGRGISDTLKRILLKTMTGSELMLSACEVGKIKSMAKQRLSRVEMILPSENSEAGQ